MRGPRPHLLAAVIATALGVHGTPERVGTPSDVSSPAPARYVEPVDRIDTPDSVPAPDTRELLRPAARPTGGPSGPRWRAFG